MLFHDLTGLADSIKDFEISAAAAEIAVKSGFDFLLTWFWFLVEQGLGGDDHPRDAEAALNRPPVEKGLLNGMKIVAIRETLNGGDFLPFAIGRQGDAREDRPPINDNGARAAFRLVARGLCSC